MSTAAALSLVNLASVSIVNRNSHWNFLAQAKGKMGARQA